MRVKTWAFFLMIIIFYSWELSRNFLISGNFLPNSVDFHDILRHFSPFLHIFRKDPKESFSCLLMESVISWMSLWLISYWNTCLHNCAPSSSSGIFSKPQLWIFSALSWFHSSLLHLYSIDKLDCVWFPFA